MRLVALGQALIRYPLSWSDELRQLVAGADAVLCNFEGCIAPPGSWPMKVKTVHPAPDSALPALKALGVTHMALANNHIWDYGPASVLATRAAAEAAGFAVAGAGADLAAASGAALSRGVALLAVDAGPAPDWAIARPGHPGINPLRLRRRLALPPGDLSRLAEIAAATGAAGLARRRQAVGYDAARPGASFYGLDLVEGAEPAEVWQPEAADMDRLLSRIASARAGADAVIVSLHYHHWNADWQQSPVWMQDLARPLAEAGATALFCHGPPVLYPMETVRGMPVASGLGNLVFHTARSATYEREGVPVWTGGALILEDQGARIEPVAVHRPPA